MRATTGGSVTRGTDVVLAETLGNVGLIRLHRPAKRNAFTAEMGPPTRRLLRGLRRLLWDAAGRGYTPGQVAELESTPHLRVMGGADAVEGIRAFHEGHPPVWSARPSTDWQDLPHR